MKTAATVFVSFLVFIGLGCSFVAGGVCGYAMARDYYRDKDIKPKVRPCYYTDHNKYARSAEKED